MELNQRLENRTELKMDQRMVLAPQIIQSIEILQLPSVELRQHVQNELETNPVLERDEETTDEELLQEEDVREEDEEDDFDDDRMLELLEEHRSGSTSYNRNSGGKSASDRKLQAMHNTPSEGPSLQDKIFQQITLEDLPPSIQHLARFLAYNLDDRGYLQVEPEEAAEIINDELKKKSRQIAEDIRARRNGTRTKDESEEQSRTTNQNEVLSFHSEDALRDLLDKNMSDDGELLRPLDEILGTQLLTETDAQEALDLLQSLDPPGVGARNQKECLILQLDRDDPDWDTKKILIEDYLEEIQENKIKQISRSMNISTERVGDLVKELKTLSSTPGEEISAPKAGQITPDVEIREVNGEFEVILLDSYVPQFHISSKYLKLLNDGDLTDETEEYVKNKLEGARNLQNSIQQRRDTIQKITACLADKQEEFLRKGINHLKPLKMQEVADEVGVHLSTVSRAADGKYVQTPRRLMRMKDFFSQGTKSSDGEGESRASVMNRIKTIIENEDKSNPLSDSKIKDKLAEKYDIDIARRTVNKYRKKMDIPSSTKRKKWASED